MVLHVRIGRKTVCCMYVFLRAIKSTKCTVLLKYDSLNASVQERCDLLITIIITIAFIFAISAGTRDQP